MMTRTFVSMAAITLACVGSAFAQGAVQWRVEDGGNGHWYQGVRHASGLAWAAASAAATARGGHLATVTSAAENQFIISTVIPTLSPFGSEFGPILGGRYVSGSWIWVTGEPWSFTAWVPGEPSSPSFEQYLHYQLPTLGWNDYDGGDGTSYSAPFRTSIVEWSADCNNDGVVDYGQCRDGTLADFNGNSVPDCCERGEPCVAGHFPTQWRTADGGNGHWYQWLGWGVEPTYDGAVSRATGRGGHLATVVSEAESLFALSVVTEDSCEPQYGGAVWLGARQQPGAGSPADGWSWVTGEPWSYVRWRADEPNDFQGVQEDRLVFSKIGGYWLDVPDHPVFSPPCVFGLLVEWSADCNGDGLVDYGQVLQGQLADANSNGVPDACEINPCMGDVSGNGLVNGIDLAAVLDAWGSDGQGKFDCDINNDGLVNGADLSIVLSDWGACP